MTTQLDPQQKSPRQWAQTLARYKRPSHKRSFFEIFITLLPFAFFWGLATYLFYYSYWWSLACILPASLLLVRLFAIQHDCGHGTLFRSRALNNWVGRILGVLTLTPYEVWRRDHAAHHSYSGNLDQRGHGDITTLTLSEYESLSPWGQRLYRIYRHPLILFGLGPAYLFLLRQRLPLGRMHEARAWLSAMGTNLAIFAGAIVLVSFLGLWVLLLIHLPIVLLAGTVGVWLFYVQHQFENTLWEPGESWDPQTAALLGSSHYDLPWALRWLTANIGAHHIHHLHSKIPYYHLGKILREHPQLKSLSRLTLWDSLKCTRLHLWDEANRKLISFKSCHPK